jgi:hypothetical protein
MEGLIHSVQWRLREVRGSVFMSRNVTFFVIVLWQASGLFAQTVLPAGRAQVSNILDQRKSAGLPKPAMVPTLGTWKYRATYDLPVDGAVNSTFSVTIKDEDKVWTVANVFEFPEGPVIDVLTLDKGTLVLRKESFKHFLHPNQTWKPVAVELDITGNKVSGTRKYVSGEQKRFSVGLSGPVFAVSAIDLTIGCLPLADGYSTAFRYFDIERLALNPDAADREKQLQLKVLGMERVMVPAGAFDSYKVELTSPDGSYKETLWIAKDSRTPVKTYTVQIWTKGARKSRTSTITELVP